MRRWLDKAGGLGALVAAAACPICFPKLAAVGALVGLGAWSAYEFQFLIAAHILVLIALAGHVIAFRPRGNPFPLAIALLSTVAFFGGLYLMRSEALAYGGLAGLLLASAIGFIRRSRLRTSARDSAGA